MSSPSTPSTPLPLTSSPSSNALSHLPSSRASSPPTSVPPSPTTQAPVLPSFSPLAAFYPLPFKPRTRRMIVYEKFSSDHAFQLRQEYRLYVHAIKQRTLDQWVVDAYERLCQSYAGFKSPTKDETTVIEVKEHYCQRIQRFMFATFKPFLYDCEFPEEEIDYASSPFTWPSHVLARKRRSIDANDPTPMTVDDGIPQVVAADDDRWANNKWEEYFSFGLDSPEIMTRELEELLEID